MSVSPRQIPIFLHMCHYESEKIVCKNASRISFLYILRTDDSGDPCIANHSFANRAWGAFSHFNETAVFFVFFPCKIECSPENAVPGCRQHRVLLCMNRRAISIVPGIVLDIYSGACFINVAAVWFTSGSSVISCSDDFVIFYDNAAVLTFKTGAAG